MGAKELKIDGELGKYLVAVEMPYNDLTAILSHLRNALYALDGGAEGVVKAAIKISDNIICKHLFGEVLYPEMETK